MLGNVKKQVDMQMRQVDAHAIQSVFEPMIRHFGVEYAAFSRGYRDGSDTNLSTHPDWIDFYYRHYLYRINVLEAEIETVPEGMLLLSQLSRESQYFNIQQSHRKLDSALIVTKPHSSGNYCDFYTFGSYSHNPCFERNLMRQIGLVNLFVDHFYYQAADMITAVDKHRIVIPDKHSSITATLDDVCIYQNKLNRTQFVKAITKKGLIVRIDDRLVQLTKREAELVPFIVSGLTMREMAQQCCISARTVESHMNNIKHKLLADGKADLIQKLNAAV